ncbi:MAG: Hsp20/alpha crystallin family protein [Paracoccaceae bacterium]|nr:Hsp20/alpha crystallin family protein [Paracoccaceae bacterium]
MVEKTTTPAWWPGFYEPFRHLGERIADWFAPRSEAKATGANYQIAVELPGVVEKDIEVTLDDGVLTVKGEKHSERKEEGEGYFFSEREYGRFQRTFRLPADARGDGVSADFANGVLKITVPKVAEEKIQPKKIKVKTA